MSKCFYCKKESNGNAFCKECSLKRFNFKPEDEYEITKHEIIKIKENEIKDKEEDKTYHNPDISYSNWLNRYNIPKGINLDNILAKITICNNCGKESNGYTYCWECYQKYKNSKYNNHKENAKGYMSYDGKYTLKSKSEKTIYDFLTRKGFICEYEKTFECDNGLKIRPDFYIKGPYLFNGRIIKNIYIEHWGGLSWEDPIKREKYRVDRINKIQQYKRSNITLISTYEEDMENCEEALTKKLKGFVKNEINY